MSEFWSGKRVIVTGGAGFLGSYLCNTLQEQGAWVFVPRSFSYDLRDQDAVEQMFTDVGQVDVLFHLAATVGGIKANAANPAITFYDNMMMGLNVIDACHRYKVGKVLVAGSVCAYPKHTPVPFNEANLWEGYPEESNGPYGVAKRALLTQLQAYKKQFGLNGVYLLLANIYGPNDNIDLETSHVIPALIRRFIDARIMQTPQVTLWGTGRATRDFLYVEDAANAFLTAVERVDDCWPINIGTGTQTSIERLAAKIAQFTGYKGDIVWDDTKPDGQLKRVLSGRTAKYMMGWQAVTSLDDGLKKTVEWYERHLCASSS